MKRSATSNHSDTSAVVPFKEAVRAVGVAWRRKHKYEPVPALSHALSILEGNTWTVLDAELGEVIAVVVDGMAELSEDLDDEEVA